MGRSGDPPAIRMAIRMAIRTGAALLALAALAGCSVWAALTGSAEDEAIAVLTAVLNVFWDTLATADTGYDPGTGTFTYAGSDGDGGTFLFEWRADESVELRFTDYTPPSSGFELNGVLTQGGGEEFWQPGTAAIEGEVFLVGATEESMNLDLRLHGELDETGRLRDDADFHGTIDGASIDEEWGMRPIAVRNHNLAVQLRAAAMQ